MISVRSHRTTYLCLKDDSYTGYYTVLNREVIYDSPRRAL
jgi:hypothetical protein